MGSYRWTWGPTNSIITMLYHSIVTIIVFSFLAVQTESQECRKNGFFRHPEDCTRFYRCVDLTGRGYFQKYTFSCPVGTVFDENVSVCNHPWAAPPCEESESEETTEASIGVVEEGDEEEESNTVIVAPEFAFDCSAKGIFGHDSDCAKFWLCKSEDGNPELYKWPSGYLFNNEARRCVEEDQVECDKKMDMVMLRTESSYVNQLKVSQLASFFYRYATL